MAIATLTIRSIIQAFNAASNDATRYALNFVKISKDYIEATDGRVLCRVKLDDSDFKDDLKNETYYADREHLPLFKAVLKQYKNFSTMPTTSDHHSITCGFPGRIQFVLKTAESLSMVYPNTDSIWPKDFKDPYVIS